MSEMPKVDLVQSIRLTPDMVAKIEEYVRQCVLESLSDTVRECLKEMDLEKTVEKQVSRALGARIPERDINVIRQKLEKDQELTDDERDLVERHVLKSMSDELGQFTSGTYVAISLEGEILAHSDSRLDLLKKLDRIDYPANKIFLHRIGKEAFVGRI